MLPLVAAGALYGLLCLMLGTALPALVPLGWDADLLVTRLVPRGQFALLTTGIGAVVAAASAGGAALVRWYAPTSTPRQAVLRRLVAADLVHLGTVTLLFLSAELAVVYGQLGQADAISYASVEAALTASRVAVEAPGSRLPVAALVVLGAYLAYLLAWGVWLGPRRYRPEAVRTADSPV